MWTPPILCPEERLIQTSSSKVDSNPFSAHDFSRQDNTLLNLGQRQSLFEIYFLCPFPSKCLGIYERKFSAVFLSS